MEYNCQMLAKLSGVTTRTLRYYDQIGLLKPARLRENGYRVYGPPQLDRLQQILFYRELGMELEDIGKILDAPGFDRAEALKSHLLNLRARRERIDRLIGNVLRTLDSIEGETIMMDREKFEGFKRESLRKNEEKYGKELRERYGEATMDAANRKYQNQKPEEYQMTQNLEAEIAELLKRTVKSGNPASDEARQLCEKHAEWLKRQWPQGLYTKEAHLELVRGYLLDDRFKAYYEKIIPGGAEFLLRAMEAWI